MWLSTSYQGASMPLQAIPTLTATAAGTAGGGPISTAASLTPQTLAAVGGGALDSGNTSVAVFLFAKEKLLFRYPDTDPFVVDLAAQSSSAANGTSSAAAAKPFSRQAGGAAGDGTEMATSATLSLLPPSSDRARGGCEGAVKQPMKETGQSLQTRGSGKSLPSEEAAAVAKPASARGSSVGSGSRRRRGKHAALASPAGTAELNDKRDHGDEGGSGGPSTNSTAGGGVALQRSMRRPASSSQVSDTVGSDSSIFQGTHGAAGGPGGGGVGPTTSKEGRRGSAGGRMPVTAAVVPTPETVSRSARGAAGGKGGGPLSSGSSRGRNHGRASIHPPLSPTAATSTTPVGVATCVGIAPSVLMHLLRGAHCGSTTISVASCTFLVFPMNLAVAGTAGGGGVVASDRPRPSQRSETVLLVVAMRECDLDTDAVANFTQCFVNVLCREEQRCRYVTNELARMEWLSSRWEVGGAAALASAATTGRRPPPPGNDGWGRHTHMPGTADGTRSFLGDSVVGTPTSPSNGQTARRTASHSGLSPPHVSRSDAARRDGVEHAQDTDGGSAKTIAEQFDYLFSKPRSALRTGQRGSTTSPLRARAPSDALKSHLSRDWSPSTRGQRRSSDSAGEDALKSRDGDGSSSQLPPPSSGHHLESTIKGEHGGRRSSGLHPSTLSVFPTTSGSLYLQLATYVRLALEVRQIAQCIDMWNNRLRTGRAQEGGLHTYGGDSADVGGSARRSMSTVCSSGVERRADSKRISDAATHDLQQQLGGGSSATGDALPEELFINDVLKLPLSYLTGVAPREGEQSRRSAYARFYPCSVVTIEEQAFDESLERLYLGRMGRRYAKLIPLARVYTILKTLASPRRVGALYRGLELALLEAENQRHRPLTPALVADTSGEPPNACPEAPSLRGSSETLEEDLMASRVPSLEGHATSTAGPTAACGVDLLTMEIIELRAMEVIDFLRSHGVISVTADMYVCLTHGEVTPVKFLEAAAARRRRHRLKAQRRHAAPLDATAAVTRERQYPHPGAPFSGDNANSRDVSIQSPTRMGTAPIVSPAPTATVASDTSPASRLRYTEVVPLNTSGSVSDIDRTLEAARDVDTLPTTLGLHMLEGVVEEQQRQWRGLDPIRNAVELHDVGSASAGKDGAAIQKLESPDLVHADGTAGMPGGVSPPSSTSASIGSFFCHGTRSFPEDSTALRPCGKESNVAIAAREVPHLSPHPVQEPPPKTTATEPSLCSGHGAPLHLSVYCAWGSACPLCEVLMAQPQHWTARRCGTPPFVGGDDPPRKHPPQGGKGDTRKDLVKKSVGGGAPNRNCAAFHLSFQSLDAQVRKCAAYASHLRHSVDPPFHMRSGYVGTGGAVSSALFQRHSLQPWFVRPHLFITPATAIEAVSPFQVFECMNGLVSRPTPAAVATKTASYGLGTMRSSQSSPTAVSEIGGVGSPPTLMAGSTGSWNELGRRDLFPSCAPSFSHEATMMSTHSGTTITAAAAAAAVVETETKERGGHSLLQSSDIPSDAAQYLHRCADTIRERLAYARRQHTLLDKWEEVMSQQRTGDGPQQSRNAATPGSVSVNPSMKVSDAVATAADVPSEKFVTTAATATSPPSPERPSTLWRTLGHPAASSVMSVRTPTSATEPLPRSLRYGRRKLPTHVATSPVASGALLFDSSTPSMMNSPITVEYSISARLPHGHKDEPTVTSSPATAPMVRSRDPHGAVSVADEESGGGLDKRQTLPTEVLLQYVLHFLFALTWGTRGMEVETLLRLLERNLCRLPPLLANLTRLTSLRRAGYASATATTTHDYRKRSMAGSGVAAEGTAVLSPFLPKPHQNISWMPLPHVATNPEEGGAMSLVTSPNSGFPSHTLPTGPVSEGEVLLLQSYEVLEKLGLMPVLQPYASWQVHPVPTRLLLHAVVNEFSDILFVSTR